MLSGVESPHMGTQSMVSNPIVLFSFSMMSHLAANALSASTRINAPTNVDQARPDSPSEGALDRSRSSGL
jgi:hypothetical protein